VLDANIAEEPRHLPSLELALTAYATLGRHDRILACLDRMVEASPDPEEQARVLMRAAAVAVSELEDADRAERYYRDILALFPFHAEAGSALADLLRNRGDRAGLRALLADQVALLEGRGDTGDHVRVAGLRRSIAGMALQDGDSEAATLAGLDILKAVRPGAEDFALSHRIYEEAGRDPDLFDAIAEAYERTVDREGLLAFLKPVAALDLAKPTRRQVLERAIAVEEALGLEPELFEDLASLVALAPEDPALRKRLEGVARRTGRLGDAVDRLGRAFAAHQGTQAAFDLAVTASRILREDLQRDEEAADYLRVAHGLRPEDASVVETLADLYVRLGSFGDLSLLYEGLGDSEADPGVRVGLYFKAFDVLRHRMKDAQGASEMLKRILDLEPSNRAALDELESVAIETSDAATLVLALGRKAEVAASATERRSILLELARVQDVDAGDTAAAATTLREVVDTDGKCTEAYDRLVELLGRTGRHEDLANLYERAVDWQSSPAEKVSTLKRAAALREGNLADARGASTLLLRILDVDPADTFAFVRLSEILQREEDFNGLVDLLRRRLQVASATGEIADLNTRAGAILAERLGDEAGAVQHFKVALQIDPYLVGGRAGLERLLDSPLVAMEAALALEGVYEVSGEALKLCDVLRAELAFVGTDEDRETILLRIAEVCADRLSDASGALAALGEALEVNPANAETIERMEAAAGRTAQWQAFYASLDHVAPRAGDPDVAARIHRKAAEVADRRLHILREAADHYDAYLGRVPGDLDALEAVDRICTELGRSEDLARVLRLRLAAAGDRADPDLRIRLASLLAKDLSDADGAVDQLRLALAARPGDREAIRQVSTLVSHPVAGRIAADILVGALRESGDDSGLLWAIDRQIELAADGSDTTAMHDEAAAVARRLGQPGEELTHLGRALGQRPSHEGLMGRLLEVGQRNDALRAEAVGHLEDAAGRANWTELERTLRIQAARLALPVPGLAASAEAQMKRVLEIDPTCREAVEMLEGHYSGSGRTEDLNWLLERKLDLDLTVPERLATLRRLSDLHLLRRDVRKAAVVLEECMLLEPGDLDTLRRLKGVLEEIEDFRGQISVLERLAAATPDAAEKRECLFDRARILQDRLGELSGAKDTLENLLTLDPRHSNARERLMALYEYLEDFKPLVDMLQAVVRADGAAPGRIEAAMRAASIAEDHLEDLPGALAMLRKASELAPDDLRIADEQIRLSYRAEDWAGLVEALRRKTALATAPAERIVLLVQAAEVARVNLLDLEMAGNIAREVLALDPSHATGLLTVAYQMEGKGAAEEALALFRRLSEATGDMDQRVEALLGVSRTLLATGQKGPEVRNALLSAARIKPNHPQVTKQLRQMYLEAEDYEALVDVMRRQLSMAATDAERATLNMDIAEVYLSKLRDGQQFIQYAEEAHRFRRDDPRVVLAIVNYYLMLHDSRRAVPYLEWLVKYLEAKRRLRELPPYAHELGRIMEASGDADKAIEYYRLCHEHDAANLDNSLALGRLYRSRGDNDKALRIYQPLLLRLDSLKASNQVEILLALAGLVFAGGDKRKARQYVQRVLSIEPDNVDAQALLARCD
jgi:tetratricopeptide (TPR) repeat protein